MGLYTNLSNEVKMTEQIQGVETPVTENKVENKVETPVTENKVENVVSEKHEPYKTFTSKEEFDKHSAGILNSAKNKAEKELLSMLGLKPDEKDKLVKFKEAYDNTLSESEKQVKMLENLTEEVKKLQSQLAEKEAIIAALSKMTGKKSDDVNKLVRMAKGLIDENTTIEQAVEQVFDFVTRKEKTMPSGKPLNDGGKPDVEKNPFKSNNLTEQGKLIRDDRQKAREYYFQATGKHPSW